MATIQNTELIESIYADLDANFEEIVSWRRYMHQHPELSFKEEKTAKFIEEKLVSFGLDVRTNVGGFGLVAVLEGEQPGKTIAFRADFDALPIQDEKETPYKSLNQGVMHACGHDGHTAALLGTAQTLSRYRKEFEGESGVPVSAC